MKLGWNKAGQYVVLSCTQYFFVCRYPFVCFISYYNATGFLLQFKRASNLKVYFQIVLVSAKLQACLTKLKKSDNPVVGVHTKVRHGYVVENITYGQERDNPNVAIFH